MVVIPRKEGEAIVIGDNMEIVVVAIRGEKVRLQISVPDDIPVYRAEVYELIRRHNASSQSTPESPPQQD